LILPFTVLIMHFHMKKPSSLQVVGACAIVCIGFLTGVSGEIKLSWLGVFFGVTSSITTAFHAVLIKDSLDIVNQNTMDLVFYNNVLTAVFLLPLILLSGEISPFIENVVFSPQPEVRLQFFIGLLITVWTCFCFVFVFFWTVDTNTHSDVLQGLFGYLINVAGFLQIKVTSPLSHMISSAVRGVLQTVIAVWLFGDSITSGKAAGIALILIGSSYYTYVKSKESGSAGH